MEIPYLLSRDLLSNTTDYNVSNGRQIINLHSAGVGPSLMSHSPYSLFSQSPAFSDVSLPLDDLHRFQSTPPCLKQGRGLLCSHISLPQRYSDSNAFSLAFRTNNDVHPPSKEHIPRPPNAFMLYRSHMLKNRDNADPEKRQQNLSRIAGQLWREMSNEGRTVWHKKAAEVQVAHYAKHPHYKFKPNRKHMKVETKLLKPHPYYPKPTQKLIAKSSVGPVRHARSRRVCHKGVVRDNVLGTLGFELPSSVSSSPWLSPLPLSPFLPAFSLPRGVSAHKQQDVMSQPQCINALGLELSVPRPPLFEIISDLACNSDAISPTAATFQRDCYIPKPDNVISRDEALLGLEQLRLPHNSADYDAKHLSTFVHGSSNGLHQQLPQSFSYSESFCGGPSSKSDSIFPDFRCSHAMPIDHYEGDEWNNTWILDMGGN